MAVDSESLDRLAEKIGYNYARKIENSYFRETTKATYNKWFGVKKKRSKYDPGRHGGGITIDDEGKAHYWMLKKKYYHLKKKGNRFFPEKKEMTAATRQAYKTMISFSVKVIKVKESFGIKMKMATDPNVRMYEYKGSYKATLSEGKETFDYKNGKVNQFDRMLLNSLKQWGNDEGYKLVVESTYEGS